MTRPCHHLGVCNARGCADCPHAPRHVWRSTVTDAQLSGTMRALEIAAGVATAEHLAATRTPLPWRVEYIGGLARECVVDADGNLVASPIHAGHSALAPLLAAAPELLTALIGMVNEPQPAGIERPAYQAALAAIAKAEGGAA